MKSSKEKGLLVPQSQLGKGVAVIFSLIILFEIIISFDLFLVNFFARLSVLLFFITMGLAAYLTWISNVTNHSANILGKLKQACLGEGILVIGLGFLAFASLSGLIVWLFNMSDNSLGNLMIFSLILSCFVGLKSNKSLTKDGKKIERTWLDAFVITMGQIVIIFGALVAAAIIAFILRIISQIMWRIFGR